VLHFFTSGRGWVSLDEIVSATRGNRSYLRIAMRLLTTCGWMHEQRNDRRGPLYAITAQGKLALRIAPPLYAQAHEILLHGQRLEELLSSNVEDASFDAIERHIDAARRNWFASPSALSLEAEVYDHVRGHLDGLLVGPVMVLLARRGVLADLEQGPVEIARLGGLAHRWESIFRFLELLAWIRVDQGHAELTPAGRYIAQISISYGVPVSYLPLYHQLDRLLFSAGADEETLVDPGINAWARGRAQQTYFEKVDEIVKDLFNRPLAEQPLGICDMGCGDGTFLEHLYGVIATQTARGRVLATHPVVVVGADLSDASRRVTMQRLQAACIPTFQVIHGDIANPDQLAIDMNTLGLDARGFLHVRSFLDHNRAYRPPVGYARGMRIARTAGAFAQRGTEILADFLEENLVRHLRAWVPYCERFGLLLMERHTLAPEVTAANLDKTPAAAYDGIFGYSDQYLVELAVFHDCLREAGFRTETKYQTMFPKSELATISIDLLVGAAA